MPDNVTEVSQNEYEALCLSLDKKRLRKRLMDAKAVLRNPHRAWFNPGIYKHAERALYSDAKFGYKLQWQTRRRPDQPESYDNQQTAIGSVYLIELERP